MKRSDRKTVAWIARNSKPQALNIILLTILYASIAIIGVVMSVLSKDIIDAACSGNYDGIVFYSALLIAMVFLQIVVNISSRIVIFNISAKLEITMKTHLFKQMLKKEYSEIKEFHSGELLNRLTSDISVVTGMITTLIPQITFLVVKLVGVFIVLFSVDKLFALIFFVGGGLLFLISQLFKGKIKNLHKEVQETDGKVRSFLQEVLSSLLVIKVFRAESKVGKNAEHLQEENYKVKRKRNYISIFATTGFSFVFTIGYFYGMIWGAFNIYAGLITYGTLTAVLSLVAQIQSPISGLSGILPQYYSALASAERIMDIETMDDEPALNVLHLDVQGLYSKMKSIEFDDITFSYDSEKIFDHTSLHIQKGDYVIISGISGIGKSTLTRLLLSVFHLDGGEIYLQMEDGSKVMADKRLRKIFAYVPQGNFLLSGTIRENISFVYPAATDADIMEAAKISCAEDFIRELPHGLDTVIGEKGSGLSEGQVQRVAIARALLGGAPILLLDEATSALDEKTEKRLLENLKKQRDITCILVSHKKAAETVCNKKVVIRDKKIIVTEQKHEETY